MFVCEDIFVIKT